jgi:hypothetical protein
MAFPFAAIALAGTFLSHQQGQKAARANKTQQELQQRISDVKASREKSKLLREARRTRATLAQNAVNTGVSGSSGATAGQSGVRSQLASGVSFLDQVQSLSQTSNIFAQKAADARGNQKILDTLAGFSLKAAEVSGDWANLVKPQGKPKD